MDNRFCRCSSVAYILVFGLIMGLSADATVEYDVLINQYEYLSQWGNQGASDGQFSRPREVAQDSSGNVYVADTFNHRIQKFNSNGEFLSQWGSPGTGDGQFYYPSGVAVDSMDNVYVADTSNRRIQKFDSSGQFLAKWGSPGTGDGQFYYPWGVAVGSMDDVYVNDYSRNCIQKFDCDGGFLCKWGSPGAGDGQFDRPGGIAIDSSGDVYVSDMYNHRIQKFDGDGQFLATWGIQGSGDGQLDTPWGMAVDSMDNILVAEYGNFRIQKFDSNGQFLAKWGSKGAWDGQFNRPCGVVVDSENGDVYVADMYNHRIQKFGLTMSYWEVICRTLDITPVDGVETDSKLFVHDIYPTADVFHYVRPIDPSAGVQPGLSATYEVLVPAEGVKLTCGSGSAYWDFVNMETVQNTPFYSFAPWYVHEAGIFEVDIPFTGQGNGEWFPKGAYCYIQNTGFLVWDFVADRFLNVISYGRVKSLRLLYLPEVRQDLCFTVANLSGNNFDLSIGQIASDFAENGYVGAEVLLTDADGDVFDIPGAEVFATIYVNASDPEPAYIVNMVPREGLYDTETLDYRAKFIAEIPSNEKFEVVDVTALIRVINPYGEPDNHVRERTITSAQTAPVDRDIWLNTERRDDLVNSDGTLIESRKLWIGSHKVKWHESANKVNLTIQACEDMGANILTPYIYIRGFSMVPSDILNLHPGVCEEIDTFDLLITEAQDRGMEVMPALTCVLGNVWGGTGHILDLHPEWAAISKTGEPYDSFLDIHRPEFRQFLISYMVEVASNYDIAGFTLDYVRTFGTCYCQDCQDEYYAATGRDLLTEDYREEIFIQWQEETVRTFVQEVRTALDAVDPGLLLCTWGQPDHNYQGRRPDIWLNQGLIDWFEISWYGGQPEYCVREWVKYAKMVDEPERVWPTFGMNNSTPVEEPIYGYWPRTYTVTGDKAYSGSALGGQRIYDMYQPARDTLKLNGVALFDLMFATWESCAEIGEMVFPEPALPWAP